jgi:ribosomal protein S18 acetylase RimI-like enzyme
MNMEIRNLENVDFETLFSGFAKAFSDYDIHFEKEEVRSMLKRRGYDPRLSFAVFENGGMVAFTLNGIGTFNGLATAYDTGTGTVREYRGQGIAGKIFTYSLPFLKEAGIRQYLLEVLQNNSKAISVYRRMDFEVTREFDCFRQNIGQIIIRDGNTDCTIAEIGVDSIRKAQDFCDFSPSWQNCVESMERGKSDITCLGAFVSGELVGYCALDVHTGDLSQIAVRGEFRRKGIASRLLRESVSRMKTGFVKVLNIDSGCRSLHAFLESSHIPLSSRQYEMIRPLV